MMKKTIPVIYKFIDELYYIYVNVILYGKTCVELDAIKYIYIYIYINVG